MKETDSVSIKSFPNGTQILYLPQFEEEWNMSAILSEYQEYFKNGINVKQGDTVFDIGANIGVFSLAVYDRCKGNIRIFLFEPIPEIYEKMKKNIEIYENGKMMAFPLGISNKSAIESFSYYPNAPCLSTYNSEYIHSEMEQIINDIDNNKGVIPDIFSESWKEESEDNHRLKRMKVILGFRTLFKETIVECKVKTLSEVIKENDILQIDLLKVDVSGSELDVFLGIQNKEDWMKIKQIVVKLPKSGGNLKDLTDLLQEKGYIKLKIEQQDSNIKAASFFWIYAKR